MSDISREACDEVIEYLEIMEGLPDEAAFVLALRAALDAAEVDKRQAVLDERKRCAGLIVGACDYLLADGMPAYLDLSDIEVRDLLAAIRNQGEPK